MLERTVKYNHILHSDTTLTTELILGLCDHNFHDTIDIGFVFDSDNKSLLIDCKSTPLMAKYCRISTVRL